MNFLGVGSFELIIIMLVAFIFLGPERMVDAARLLGRLTREVRRMTSEVRSMVDIDELTNPRPSAKASGSDTQPDQPEAGPPSSAKDSSPNGIASDAGQSAADSEAATKSDGPVSFKSAGKSAGKSARELDRETMKDRAADPDDTPNARQEGTQQEERS